jgi:hypothetical protein
MKQKLLMFSLASFLLLGLSACPQVLRSQLESTAIVNPPSELVEVNRKWVQDEANFKCPPHAVYAYLVVEVRLSDNSTRVGIRCQ